MKFNSTVALTLILLAMMLGAGFVSAMWGFTLGHEALKGVTQPDVRPTKKLADNKQATPGKEGVAILREEDILVNVNEYINNKGKESKTDSLIRRMLKRTIAVSLRLLQSRRLSRLLQRHPLQVQIPRSSYRSKVRTGE
jgi:hypothetical protein